jgi:hypothetical protein
MPDITRREFPSAAVGSAVSAAAAPPQPLYLYMRESYTTADREAPFVLGFLITRTPERHLRTMRELRQRLNYRRELAHRSNDRLKISYARELLHYFVRDPELRFIARIVADHRWRDVREFTAFRASQYPELVRQTKLEVPAVVRIKRHRSLYAHSRWDVSEEQRLRIDPLNKAGYVTQADAILSSAKDGLMELASILNGSLFRDAVRRFEVAGTSRPKTQVAARLRQLLGLESLTEAVAPKWQPLR